MFLQGVMRAYGSVASARRTKEDEGEFTNPALAGRSDGERSTKANKGPKATVVWDVSRVREVLPGSPALIDFFRRPSHLHSNADDIYVDYIAKMKSAWIDGKLLY